MKQKKKLLLSILLAFTAAFSMPVSTAAEETEIILPEGEILEEETEQGEPAGFTEDSSAELPEVSETAEIIDSEESTDETEDLPVSDTDADSLSDEAVLSEEEVIPVADTEEELTPEEVSLPEEEEAEQNTAEGTDNSDEAAGDASVADVIQVAEEETGLSSDIPEENIEQGKPENNGQGKPENNEQAESTLITEEIETEEETFSAENDDEICVEIDLSDHIIQAGALNSPKEEGQTEESFEIDNPVFYAGKTQTFSDVMMIAVENRQTSVEVSAFNIKEADAGYAYTDFVNDHPELFYLSYTTRYWYSERTGYVTKYELTYLTQYNQSHINAFNQRVDWFMSGIESGWNDEQKALYLHDKIVVECEYESKDASGNYHNYNAYNVLVDGIAVCQGYALAYKYLLQQAGIYSEVISSNALNHAWNTVSVYGKEYYVDCTWDDPYGVYRMYCGHDNFLRSASGMYWDTEHNQTDWVDQDGNYVINTVAQDEYPYYYWRNSVSQIPHIGSKWFYASRENCNIYFHDYSSGSDTVLTSALNGKWHVIGDSSSWYTNYFISLDVHDSTLYASQENCVKTVSLNGAVSLFSYISSSYESNGRIYGIQCNGNYLRFDIYPDSQNTLFTSGNWYLGAVNETNVTLGRDTLIMLKGTSYDLAGGMTAGKGHFTLQWDSSNRNAATVSAGKVTAVATGIAKVSVKSGQYSDTCTVNVYNSRWVDDYKGTKYISDNFDFVKSNWVTDNGKKYFFKADGYLTTGWITFNGKRYYSDSSGVMQTGLKKISNKWYYFNNAGIMQTGPQNVSGQWYIFDTSGVMQTGWQKWGNSWYYMNSSGVGQTGWQKISGKWYYFNSSAVMTTGWQKVSGLWYYMNSDGVMQTGWLKLGNTWYYLNAGGAMQTGWQKISNKWYYFQSSGAMKTGWLKLGNTWYFLNGSGVMQTGWQKISGIWYYFDGTGAMATGWKKVSGKWYYFQSSGAMKTGWLKLGTYWYYLDGSGVMVTGSRRIGDKTYRFDSSGICLNP